MKYYVVWKGRKPGIYTTWEECKSQVHKYSGAKYKSFPTLDEAIVAFNSKRVIPTKPATNISNKKPHKKHVVLPKVVFPKFPR
jgi:ribonuclease HI